jgi:cytosine/adenosine deaminase-related metal-dependent hydrolase
VSEAGDTNVTVITGVHIATMDAGGTEYADGHVVLQGNTIVQVGQGEPDRSTLDDGDALYVRYVSPALLTPGLVNCHHHMYQHLTRGYAQQSTLFEWLVELYPTWGCVDDTMQAAASRAAIMALLRSGCTLATDHHYLHPRDAGDLLAIEIESARDLGIRFHPCRGSMDLGTSHGGLPPDHVVEDRDEILAATEAAISTWHDASRASMLRIAVAPCSPFSVTAELMRESAELARRHGVRLHTHLAETVEEDAYCLEHFGMRPVDYVESLGWLGDDVWLAHCIHLSDDEVARFGATGTGVAHCPSSNARLGAGIAPVMDLVRAGAPVGLGVDGAASNECGELGIELREAMLFARLRGGPTAMSARDALARGTIDGARCLGRSDELGSIEVGKLADLVVWDLADVSHAGIDDPVASLVFGPPRLADRVYVGGELVVHETEHCWEDEIDIALDLEAQARRLTDVAQGARA